MLNNYLIWHCKNRKSEYCKNYMACKGTFCKTYIPNRGSYHSYVSNDPIKGYLDDNGNIVNKKKA